MFKAISDAIKFILGVDKAPSKAAPAAPAKAEPPKPVAVVEKVAAPTSEPAVKLEATAEKPAAAKKAKKAVKTTAKSKAK